MEIDMIIREMASNGHIFVRKPNPFSWGDMSTCKKLFTDIFCSVDRTAVQFRMLPEYEAVIEWMTDTRGKGLFLTGDCGRGKSVIAAGIIPVLLKLKRLTYPCIHADNFEDKCRWANTLPVECKNNIDYLSNVAIPIIDELGAEKTANDYGEKYEGFNKIIDAAEMKLKPLFVSTNLDDESLLNRYGERTIDRLLRLCKRVDFTGDSLRK